MSKLMMNDEPNIRVVSNDDIIKIRGNNKLYSDAMDSIVKFNKQLSLERKSRIPFLDSQTGIAQSNSMLWHDRTQRAKSLKSGQIYRYSSRNWYINRRSLFDKETAHPIEIKFSGQMINEPSDSSNISANTLTQLNLTNSFNNNSINILNNLQNVQHHQPVSKITNSIEQITNNSILSVEDDNFEYNNTNNDNENDSDYDEYDDYKPRKSAKKAKVSKKKSDFVDEKPYSCDKCGIKYKTKPGLNYHIQKAHNSTASSGSSNISNLKINEILNTDENANSIFDSAFDDMNSSSSLPHISASFNIN